MTVPTPIDDAKRPDFAPLESASQTVGGILKKGDIVVYESTVYPARPGGLRPHPGGAPWLDPGPGFHGRLLAGAN